MPTAPTHSLDADVIIAAQAEQVEAVVVTGNVKHLSHFVDARDWRDIV